MKKILLLIPQNVIPVTDGGKAGIYNPMRMLAGVFDVRAFVFTDVTDVVNEHAYKQLGVQVTFLQVDKKDRLLKMAFNFLYRLPFKFNKYYTKQHQQTINTFCKQWQPDIVICHHAHLAAYCRQLKKYHNNVQLVLREHNIEYLLVQQYYELQTNWLKKIIAYWQYLKTKKAEELSWNWFDKILFISDTDFQLVPATIRQQKGLVLYDGGVLVNKISTVKKPYFLFTGKVSSLQNKTNLAHFVHEVWIPWKKNFDTYNYELWVTGNTPEELAEALQVTEQHLQHFNIKAVGFVDNLTQVIQEAKFVISPTIIGAGIRIKVLEALCYGSVVFLTEKDLQMVGSFKNLYNVVLYNNVDDFNSQFLLLHTNEVAYNALSANAYHTASTVLTWDVFFQKLQQQLQ